MTFRVILLSLFTLMAMFLSTLEGGVVRVVLIVLWSIGLFAIFETIRTYKHLQFHAGVLTIKQSFDRIRSFPLTETQQWHEIDTYINSMRRRHLILFIKNGEKIVISNYDDHREYEKIIDYLNQHLSQLKR
jgi:hypothetical protein